MLCHPIGYFLQIGFLLIFATGQSGHSIGQFQGLGSVDDIKKLLPDSEPNVTSCFGTANIKLNFPIRVNFLFE